MSHNISPSSSPSNAPPSSNHNHDFISLASAFQDMAQVLLGYTQPDQGNTPAQKKATPEQQQLLLQKQKEQPE